MNILLKELKIFSKDNWWVYLLFIIALAIVAYTGKGNLLEVTILFGANFFGNLCVMAMQGNYTAKNNKVGARFQLLAVLTFLTLGLYGLFYLDQFQYIIWQIAYTISVIKTVSHYNFKLNLKFINAYLLVFVNVIFLIIFYNYFYTGELSFLIQALGFAFSSTGFIVLNDTKRYYTILIGTWLIVLGSLFITYNSFVNSNVDGIALGYLLLSGTVGVYYLKLLKKYL